MAELIPAVPGWLLIIVVGWLIIGPMSEHSVTVFCSSSDQISPVFLEAAAELGAAIAREKWQLIYGGNAIGSMGALANAARSAGGRVIGITPQLLVDKGYADRDCHELIITPDMRSRKAKLETLGDACVALPGGFGTLEELSEMLVGRLLKYHAKPVVILNIAGFYDPLLDLFEKMIGGGFAKPKHRGVYKVADSVVEAIEHLKAHWGTNS
jgi:uncharacterized protein (TIGR00730 family)